MRIFSIILFILCSAAILAGLYSFPVSPLRLSAMVMTAAAASMALCRPPERAKA